MSFPTTGLLDDFNRADGGLGPNWGTGFGDAAINVISNTAGSSIAGFGGAYWANEIFGSDVEAYLTLTATGASGQRTVINVRGSAVTAGAWTGLELTVDPLAGAGNWILRQVLAGTATTLTTATQAVAAGDSIGLEALGPNLTAYYKASGGSWASVLTTRNGAVTQGGRIGIELADNVARVENFSGGSIVPQYIGGYANPARPIGVGMMKYLHATVATLFTGNTAVADASLPPHIIEALQGVNRSSTW